MILDIGILTVDLVEFTACLSSKNGLSVPASCTVEFCEDNSNTFISFNLSLIAAIRLPSHSSTTPVLDPAYHHPCVVGNEILLFAFLVYTIC